MDIQLWPINNLTFHMNFELLKLTKSLKFKKIRRFWIKEVSFTQILLNNPIFFVFPKFLEIFSTLKKTPPKVKNSKPDKRDIFLGHPVYSGQQLKLCAISFKKETLITIIVLKGIDFLPYHFKDKYRKISFYKFMLILMGKLWLFMLIFTKIMLLPQNAATWP